MVALDAFYLKTADQIRDDMLRTYANALIRRGITNPNVSEGTEIFIKYTAIANQLAVAMSNTQLMADAVMPDSAQGTDLEQRAAPYGLKLKVAGPSAGFIVLASTVSSPILIPVGSQLIDPTGLVYKVSVGGSYSNGALVPIVSVATGSSTNLAAGIVLKWNAPPPFVSQTALVSTGGLIGGADAENHEGLRTRLIEYFRNSPGSGNWSQINAAAEGSTVAVQKSFTYCAANGPSTVHVAVVTAPTATNKNRDLDVITLTTIVTPAISAILPQEVELVVTTVINIPENVAIAMSLPASTAASPPGPGGGWLDATPFPVFASSGHADVGAVTSTTVFDISSDVAPAAGISRICWLSPFDWKVYKATVVSFVGLGPYTVTIDQPFVGIATGQYISPQAQNTDAYFAALLAFFAQMGPGQKTNVPGVLPRAYRKPLTTQSWPSDANATMLKAMENAGDEVLDVAFLFRSSNTPGVPSLITFGPTILVPNKLAFYPL